MQAGDHLSALIEKASDLLNRSVAVEEVDTPLDELGMDGAATAELTHFAMERMPITIEEANDVFCDAWGTVEMDNEVRSLSFLAPFSERARQALEERNVWVEMPTLRTLAETAELGSPVKSGHRRGYRFVAQSKVEVIVKTVFAIAAAPIMVFLTTGMQNFRGFVGHAVFLALCAYFAFYLWTAFVPGLRVLRKM